MNSKPAGDIPALTGLRGLAAFTVFVAHFKFATLLPETGRAMSLFDWHNEAVDLFFILSGFILNYVYAVSLRNRTISWHGYIGARIARIFPLHLVVLIPAVGIHVLAWVALGHKPRTFDPVAAAWNVPLLQNWPGIFTESSVGPAWSLSVEWLCYLTVFPACVFLRLTSVRRSVLWGSVIALVAARMATTMDTHGWPALTRGLLGFLIGWLLHGIFMQRRPHASGGGFLLAASAVGFLVALGGSVLRLWPVGWTIPVFPFLIYGLVTTDVTSFVNRMLQHRIMLWLGMISYSVYLWHPVIAWPTVIYLRPHLVGTPLIARATYALLEVAVVLLVAAISYRTVEQPARLWLKRVFGRKPVRVS